MDAAGVKVSWTGCCAFAGKFGPCVCGEIAREEVSLAFYTIVTLRMVPTNDMLIRITNENEVLVKKSVDKKHQVIHVKISTG